MLLSEQINFSYRPFLLKEGYFDHHSHLHGISHTYRVMYHVLNIGKVAGLNHEIKLAFCAAFIHDMARRHDGYCTEHGVWSSKSKLPVFSKLFVETGVNAYGLRAIKLAVSNHSIRHEISKENPYFTTVALLKDADALDRIRIGDNNLKPQYLRFPESHNFIGFAKELYYRSNINIPDSFDEIIEIGQAIGKI
jgi:HD superfamily phosphodiesterase